MHDAAKPISSGAPGHGKNLYTNFRSLGTRIKGSRLDRVARQVYGNFQRVGRDVAGVDKRIIDQYLDRHSVKKLHLGCGHHPLVHWLNTDLSPRIRNVVAVDVTRKFPFPAETFDYVFSEHMIEHISYTQGHAMLRECFRILKPGGKIRVSTPDLAFLIDMYAKPKSELQDRYIKWVTESFIRHAPACEDVFVINNFVRDWGHTFIYDEKTLKASLEMAGFKNISRCGLNESDDKNLRYLENESRMPPGFVRLESLTLEASRCDDSLGAKVLAPTQLSRHVNTAPMQHACGW
jgi:predicted SAM-dependent methyltransferase